MIDLDLILNKTIDFKINGEVLNVKQPSVKVINQFTKMSGDILEQAKIVKDILNNNTNGKTYSDKDINDMPELLIVAIIKEISNYLGDMVNEKN